jgi:hypothetical protein
MVQLLRILERAGIVGHTRTVRMYQGYAPLTMDVTFQTRLYHIVITKGRILFRIQLRKDPSKRYFGRKKYNLFSDRIT